MTVTIDAPPVAAPAPSSTDRQLLPGDAMMTGLRRVKRTYFRDVGGPEHHWMLVGSDGVLTFCAVECDEALAHAVVDGVPWMAWGIDGHVPRDRCARYSRGGHVHSGDDECGLLDGVACCIAETSSTEARELLRGWVDAGCDDELIWTTLDDLYVETLPPVHQHPVPAKSPTTTELLLAWDRERPRSKQRRFGMSELGGCRRRAGYRLAGIEPTNDSGSMQAILGTAIHEAVAQVFAKRAMPGDLVEHEVEFAGILGHLDRYEAATATVIDVKTTTEQALSRLEGQGPYESQIWQVTAYAAALIAEGYPVARIRIDYLARDTGREWSWSAPFDPKVLREAIEWVRMVESTELEFLPRDYAPDSAFCENCPFRELCWEGGMPGRDPRTVLYVEDPDAAKWAARLAEARADKVDAEKREEAAKGALDAIRPEQGGTVDVGWDRPLVWTKVKGRRTLDKKAVEADYKAAGGEAPYKVGEPTFRLGFGSPATEASKK